MTRLLKKILDEEGRRGRFSPRLLEPDRFPFAVFRKVGTENDLRKKGAIEIRNAEPKAEDRIIQPELVNGWKFGCEFAGRGLPTSRVVTITPGSEPVSIHEAEQGRGYVDIPKGQVEGEFLSYKKVRRVLSSITTLEVNQIRELIAKIVEDSPGPVLVTGGHYMPFLHDVRLVRGSPIGTLVLALQIIEALKESSREVDLGIVVNDLHMLEGTRTENPIRRAFWDGLVLPAEYERVIRERIDLIRDLSVLVVGERVLFNRFAHQRKDDRPDQEKIREWLEATETKCVGALAYFLKFAKTLGYQTIIQIFPTCDRNSPRAAQAAAEVYGSEAIVPRIHFIYTTIGC